MDTSQMDPTFTKERVTVSEGLHRQSICYLVTFLLPTGTDIQGNLTAANQRKFEGFTYIPEDA
jgi:hypothetical protein